MKKTVNEKKEVKIIDAAGKSVGRISTEAVIALRGKDSPYFVPNRVTGSKVKIVNASLFKISKESKLKGKEYIRYSGYPGGQKKETMESLIKRKGYSEILKKAIYGMIPNNKLRSKLMLRLQIVD